MGSGLEVGTPGEVALWECVLALWRLKLTEEKGSEDLIWLQHVSAWMVSNEFAMGVDRGELICAITVPSLQSLLGARH